MRRDAQAALALEEATRSRLLFNYGYMMMICNL